MSNSPKGKLSKEDIKEVLKVALWSIGSAILAGLIYFAESDQLPDAVAVYAPMINTFLYGAFRWWKNNKL